jgi:hypothetical protein
MNQKKALLITLLVILFFSIQLMFGCTISPSDEDALKKFTQLQTKYGVTTAFSTNLAVMDNYTTDLAALRGKTTGSAAKIIEAELYSAQAFYYYNTTISLSREINYQNIVCSSKATKDTISSITMAKEKVDQAVNIIQSLNSEQLAKLRPNQLDNVKKYQASIDGIYGYFEEKC